METKGKGKYEGEETKREKERERGKEKRRGKRKRKNGGGLLDNINGTFPKRKFDLYVRFEVQNQIGEMGREVHRFYFVLHFGKRKTNK